MRHPATILRVLQEALAVSTAVRFRAEGDEMDPAIRNGEIITITPPDPGQLVVGDVVLCRHADRLRAERVVDIADDSGARRFVVRGDAAADSMTMSGADVIGKVVSVFRDGRMIALSGRRARLSHIARTAASRAKALVVGPVASRVPPHTAP
jgi:hypothetical protein